jgi:uncharacterized protein (TIGR02265 family)
MATAVKSTAGTSDADAGLAEFAAKVSTSPREQAIIVKNLATFPRDTLVRGVFLEGLSRVIAQARGPSAVAQLVRSAGIPENTIAFRQYPHRDFYKLYYLCARTLHPNMALPNALRLVARAFFPIFRASIIGKTMSALMGEESRTILPLLGKAYNLSVSGNEHTSELAGDKLVRWHCKVEPVEWYEETFTGIIEGTAPQGVAPTALKVKTVSKNPSGPLTEYRFEITW